MAKLWLESDLSDFIHSGIHYLPGTVLKMQINNTFPAHLFVEFFIFIIIFFFPAKTEFGPWPAVTDGMSFFPEPCPRAVGPTQESI